MTTRRAIQGVLEGFLGTYTSRYSDYNGYWLFGFLVADFQQLRVDLLADSVNVVKDTPASVAVELARAKFKDQVAKIGLSLECIQAAELEITRCPDVQPGMVNGHMGDGYEVLFRARATMDYGRGYECQRSLFVAPHHALCERRSARAKLTLDTKKCE